MKVYNTRPSQFLLIQILVFLRPLSSVHLLQSNQHFQTIDFVGATRFRKAINLIFPKLSSQNMRGFHHATILSSSFHGVRKERLAQWPPFLTQKRQKCPGGTSRKIGWGCAARFLKPLPYFRPKSVIFPTLFQAWSKIWYPISDLKSWSPARDRSAWQAVTARLRWLA